MLFKNFFIYFFYFHPPPVTRHPPPATRHPSPATRGKDLPVLHRRWPDSSPAVSQSPINYRLSSFPSPLALHARGEKKNSFSFSRLARLLGPRTRPTNVTYALSVTPAG